MPAVTAQAAPVTVTSGMEISIDETIITTAVCTLGAVISPTKALTAGHCGNSGQAVYDAKGSQIGTITANLLGRQADIAVITLAKGVSAQPDAVAWGATFQSGQPLSKVGVTTGFTSGAVTNPVPTSRTAHGFTLAPPFLEVQTTLSVATSVHSREGDSGAGFRDASGSIVGILSSGSDGGDTLFAPVSLVPGALR